MEYLLLAERLRVEERQLIAAFEAIDCRARLLTPAEIGSIEFGHPYGQTSTGLRPDDAVIISRLHPSREASALLWALESGGWSVIPGAAQMDVFARRDRLYRELNRSNVPVAETVFGWGTTSVLAAVDRLGWPVELLPLDGGEAGIVIEDREATEAVVEHRGVLGREHALLLRRGVTHTESRRLLIAGDDVFPAPASAETGWPGTDIAVTAVDRDIAVQVTAAINAPIVDISYVPDKANVVINVTPLLSFRSIQSEESDVACAIARCVVKTEAARG